MKNNIGCGKKIEKGVEKGYLCGIPNGWGTERFCESCDKKMKARWAKEDKSNKKLQRQLKGGL